MTLLYSLFPMILLSKYQEMPMLTRNLLAKKMEPYVVL